MQFVDVLKVLLRRWVVVLLGAVLTGGACLAVLQEVGPDYQASSQMLLLLPPDASGEETPTNPYLNVQGGLNTTASLLAGNVTTKDAQRSLAASGETAEYAVALQPGVGPLLVITAKSKDPDVALATRDAVMAQIDAELARIQEQVTTPRRQLITTQASSVSQRAEVLPGSRLRALAATGAAGALLVLLAAFALDRRRTRPPAGSASSAPAPGGAPAREADEVAVAARASRAAEPAPVPPAPTAEEDPVDEDEVDEDRDDDRDDEDRDDDRPRDAARRPGQPPRVRIRVRRPAPGGDGGGVVRRLAS